ncbi:hypothetical protein NO263_09975 [Gluconacetobacter entanii]|uniref:Uncharacterized protein n=1 Tax=Gluconacetobacter entanii TaxID=108528 RepID=A0ABT3K665_9PROT|nr:hypothetical protein [Gluconacetobacter entanii]MCW4590907.1 hypothetical protein [Gluconacetobacter entanii]MCW4592522.1 hypothetical protein [Gluconacetobacter entanii]NPC87320.1 hypothetical protein [Gluconacetobacter entanii]
MTIIPVSMPVTWNLPSMQGVPSVLGNVADDAQAMGSVTLGTMLDDYQISSAASLWGIFDATGAQVLGAAHVRAVEFESAHAISDAPQEDGAFVSYNKVAAPRRFMLEMLCDGSQTGSGGLDSLVAQYSPIAAWGNMTGDGARMVRASFLATLAAMEDDTATYAVHTPEYSLASVNVVGHRYRRETRGGVTLLAVQVMLVEVRCSATQSYTTTATAAGQVMQSGGTVQATDADTTQAAALSEVM